MQSALMRRPPVDGEWCNGSTYDSDSYCQGSNPCSPANLPPLCSGLARGPLKAETPVRIRSEVPLQKPDCFKQSGFFISKNKELVLHSRKTGSLFSAVPLPQGVLMYISAHVKVVEPHMIPLVPKHADHIESRC